ncbi:C-type lectin 37Da-like [Neocloeon triangulifer]|uniref:C-type lectin 37Da-like n=1 Tax=Neocloeon triangulifer TaxID=2078957 RepID=UPI00286F5AB3|nr:C-type lectin 37Da-like [Neocloeon triangulifer]
MCTKIFLALAAVFCVLRAGNAYSINHETEKVVSGQYITVNGRELFVGTDWIFAPDAQEQCRSIQKNLISFETAAEYTTLMDYLRANNYNYQVFWTSGVRNAGESQFYWNATQTAFTDTFWAYLQPNNALSTQACVQFTVEPDTLALWYDTPCDEYITFICE